MTETFCLRAGIYAPEQFFVVSSSCLVLSCLEDQTAIILSGLERECQGGSFFAFQNGAPKGPRKTPPDYKVPQGLPTGRPRDPKDPPHEVVTDFGVGLRLLTRPRWSWSPMLGWAWFW